MSKTGKAKNRYANTNANRGRNRNRNRIEWDPQSLREDRSYGFFWYDWLWRIIRPMLILITSAVILYGGIAFAYGKIYEKYIMPTDINDKEKITFIIESGSSLNSVSRQLEERGFIRSRTVLKYLMDFRGLGQKIQAGAYELSRSMTLGDIIEQLTKGEGKAFTRNITVIPGWTIETIAKNFAEQGIIPSEEEFLSACRSGEEFRDYYYVAQVLDTPKVNQRLYVLEGYLSPNTYQVYTNASVNDIIRRLLSQTGVVFSDAYQERAYSLGLSMDQVLTLASMIEREAKTGDFTRVSAVFHNRLDLNMRLESDVTVKYSTGSDKMALTDKELSVISAYNTYLNTGLPVGPICNPSKAAIEAALNPDQRFITERYLFFTSKEPSSGELFFSKTLEEHNAAASLYRPLWEEYDRNRGM